jgi:hypothetical protein
MNLPVLKHNFNLHWLKSFLLYDKYMSSPAMHENRRRGETGSI